MWIHNSAINVSCCYCGTGCDGAATVADSALLSPLEPPSRHGKGSPSLAGTPGLSPLAAASTLFSNQGLIVDKDDNTSITTLQSRRLSEEGINTPADPPGSDTSEREGSLDDGAQQQASIASEDNTFTTASARDTESEPFHSAFGLPQPSPQAKAPVPVEGIECRLPSISLTEAPRPTTPTPVESTSKSESQIESERAPDHRLAGMGYPKPHSRLPSSPAGPPATEQKQSFSAQAPESVPSPAPSLTATLTNVRSPDHSRQPSIDTLGPSGTEGNRNLSRGHLNEIFRSCASRSTAAFPPGTTMSPKQSKTSKFSTASPRFTFPPYAPDHQPFPYHSPISCGYPSQPQLHIQQRNLLYQNAHCVNQNDQNSDYSHSNPYESYATSTPAAPTPNAPDLQQNASIYPPETNGFQQSFFNPSNQIVPSPPALLLVN